MAANNEYIHQTDLTSQYQKDTSKMLLINSFIQPQMKFTRHEKVGLMGVRFERYFSHYRENTGRSISRNTASLNTPFHDVINLSHYEY